jgi:ribosomal protein S18 acetylase RimI-like enzyme
MKRAEALPPNRSFTVREIEIGDLGAVYELGEENFKAQLWPMLYRSWDEYEVTTLFNTDGEYCLVAENDDENAAPDERIVGFILGTVVNKPGSAWTYGYIIWLCAHPKWSREGVAGQLMDELVEIMVENEGIRIIMADTDPENERAVNFFTKKGLVDQKPHLYLSSNLEQNPQYRSLLIKYRQENSSEAEAARRKIIKLMAEKKRLENSKKKTQKRIQQDKDKKKKKKRATKGKKS